ncbi:MAG: undecaprenyl-phosphate glucose phosphotransferase [Rhodospirillaceae bacterium]
MDLVAIVGSQVLVWGVHIGFNDDKASLYILTILSNAVCTIVAFQLAGLYKIESYRHPVRQIKLICLSCLIVFSFFVILIFGLKVSSEFSRIWFFLSLVLEIFLVLVSRVSVITFIRRQAKNGKMARQIVTIGTRSLSECFIIAVREQHEPWDQIVGVFTDDPDNSTDEEFCGIRLCGGLDEIIEYARNERVDDVVICLPWSETDIILAIIDKLEELPTNIRIAPDSIYYEGPSREVSYLAGVYVIDSRYKPISGWERVAKRTEDLILASIALALLLPVMFVVACWIKLDTPGPILFKQQRHGYNNTIFNILKFRTMYVDDNDEGKQAIRHDPRVTRSGHFLRKWSIDELPQLLNVIGGTMSLVGPRPMPIYQNQSIAKEIQKYDGRHKVRPGITGLAQVNKLRGEKTIEEMKQRLKLDMYYINHWSVWLDIWILLRTFGTVLSGENAY